MTSPVTFSPCPSGNRDIAMLGDNMIGYVVDYFDAGGNTKAFWRCLLHPNDVRCRPVNGRSAGRRHLLLSTAEWFDRSGISELERLATDLRMQAEGEG